MSQYFADWWAAHVLEFMGAGVLVAVLLVVVAVWYLIERRAGK